MAYSSAPPSFQGLSGASIGSLFTTADYTSLSSASGVHAEIIGRRFNAIPAPRLADFKVPELKEILKWLRGRPNWQTNPYVNQRMSTTAGGNSGKKQQLVDHLKNILQAQAAISRGVNPADLNPNNSSLPSVPSSATLPSQQAYNPAMALQAQYRQQQAHAQAAAARFQANDPYRYQSPAGVSSNPALRPPTSTSPSMGYPPHTYSPYSHHPSQSPQQPPQANGQQFAYTNGTRDHSQFTHPQQQQAQQQRAYPAAAGQSAPPNGYQMYNPSGSSYAPQSAARPPHSQTPLSHPALQQQEINMLVSSPNMQKHLSPYEQVLQTLARAMLNSTSHSANQSTGAAGGAYHTTLNFSLPPNYVNRLKRANRPAPAGQESQMLEVHIRLFSSLTLDHFPWDKKFRVLVNGHEVTIPEPKKLSKTKKKGLELVRGLDITEFVQTNNTVEVSVYRQSYTVELFRGLVTINLLRIRDTAELMEQFRKTVKEEESKMQATALERCCVICHSKKDPLRCSKCKSEWYCLSEDHQLLTNYGFCDLTDVESLWDTDSNLQFATFNSKTGFMEFQTPMRLIVNPTRLQPMIQFGSESIKLSSSPSSSPVPSLDPFTALSLLVTPDHDMWLRSDAGPTSNSFYHKEKAAHLLDRPRFHLQFAAPRGIKQTKQLQLSFTEQFDLHSIEEVHAFLTLYGFWLGIGSTDGDAVEFHNNKQHDLALLQSSIQTLRLASHTIDSSESTYIRIADSKFAHYLDSHHRSSSSSSSPSLASLSTFPSTPSCSPKHLFSWVWQLEKPELECILNALHQAIGMESNHNGVHTIPTHSEAFRDDLIELCLRAGCPAYFTSSNSFLSTHSTSNWLIHYHNRQIECVVSGNCDTHRVHDYIGRTWCVQVPNGLLFARRSRFANGELTDASTPTIVGNCGPEHQRQHWPTHREKCVAPTPEQDQAREALEKKAAQQAMLGKNGRTRLIIPPKVKGEGDDEDGVEEVDALVSLRCPLSLERYEYPARGRNCGHLPCFDLETYLTFSQQSGVWQCPICFKGLPAEEIEVSLQMAAILRETDSEISQIRVHPNGEYDPIKLVGDEEDGGGSNSRKRKQPSASPTNMATATATSPTATQPPAKLQAIGSNAPDWNASVANAQHDNIHADGQPLQPSTATASSSTLASLIPSTANESTTISSAVSTSANNVEARPPTDAPPAYAHPAKLPEISAAGTADEPIELD